MDMHSKYGPLEIFLGNKRGSAQRVTLSFQEIEKIIGGTLPKSAHQYREWWSNQKDYKNRPQAKAWLAAGYKVESVPQSLNSGSVVFDRA